MSFLVHKAVLLTLALGSAGFALLGAPSGSPSGAAPAGWDAPPPVLVLEADEQDDGCPGPCCGASAALPATLAPCAAAEVPGAVAPADPCFVPADPGLLAHLRPVSGARRAWLACRVSCTECLIRLQDGWHAALSADVAAAPDGLGAPSGSGVLACLRLLERCCSPWDGPYSARAFARARLEGPCQHALVPVPVPVVMTEHPEPVAPPPTPEPSAEPIVYFEIAEHS